MESNVALFSAASKLEPLMAPAPAGMLKSSIVAQVSAFLYYEANVLAKFESNSAFKKLFKETIYNQIEKDFGEYIDAKARTSPKSLHHVYEWNKVGRSTSRLFRLRMIDNAGLSFKVASEFKLSKSSVPSKNTKQRKRYIFANKAEVMEAGMPLIIHPRASERLVFEMNGMTVFMPKGASVTVRRPGGAGSSHQFSIAYGKYFSGNLVGTSIRNSGFHTIFNNKIAKALEVPYEIKKVKYSFSPGVIRSEADSALTSAFGGSL